jgi:TolB-like protein
MLIRRRVAFLVAAITLLGWTVSRGEEGVELQKVEAQGVGTDYDSALNAALSHAVAEVNGVEVARQVFGESVRGTATATSSTEIAAVGGSVTERVGVAAGVVGVASRANTSADGDASVAAERAGPTDRTGAAAMVAAERDVTATRTAAVGAAHEQTRQDFAADKTIVAVAASTSGVVNRYQILETAQLKDGWHITVLAEIAKYKAANQDQRKKVAVLPLRLEKLDARYHGFETVFHTDLVNQLTQSNKVALLDRDFGAEQGAELAFLQQGGVKKEEMAKLGNRLGADYVVVGVVSDASVKTETAYIQSVGRTVAGATTAAAKISYRVVETATGRIDLADNWATSGRANGKVEDIAASAAQDVARSILEALFPMRVERVANGVYYLGQGGKSVQVGQQYRVIKLGDDITDSYTKEVIGREEEEIGLIAIFEVEPRLAKARLVGTSQRPLPEDMSGLVVRLVEGVAVPPTGARPTPTKAPPNAAKTLVDKQQSDW